MREAIFIAAHTVAITMFTHLQAALTNARRMLHGTGGIVAARSAIEEAATKVYNSLRSDTCSSSVCTR
jgi:hypothetical protein